MNEPNNAPRPRWFARPVVWLCGGGLLMMLLTMAVWWAARTGVRAMESQGAYLECEVSRAAFWAEENLDVDTDEWMWDGNVTAVLIEKDETDEREFGDAALLELSRFAELNWLMLYGVSVTDAGVTTLVEAGGLRQLAELHLFECHAITGRSLVLFSQLPELKELTISSASVAVSGTDLVGFSNLQSLRMNKIPLTNSGLADIARLPKLTSLELCNTTINDEGLTALAQCPRLTSLDLSGSQVTDAGVLRIPFYCPALEKLTLWDTAITDDCLNVVDELSNLREFYVTDTAVSDQAIERVLAAHPSVHVEK